MILMRDLATLRQLTCGRLKELLPLFVSHPAALLSQLRTVQYLCWQLHLSMQSWKHEQSERVTASFKLPTVADCRRVTASLCSSLQESGSLPHLSSAALVGMLLATPCRQLHRPQLLESPLRHPINRVPG